VRLTSSPILRFEYRSPVDANPEQPPLVVIWAVIATENVDHMIEDTEMTEATTAMKAVGVPLMTDTLRIGTIDVMTDRVITTAGMIDTTEIMSADLATMTVDRIVVVVMVLLLIAETVDLLPDIRNLMFDAFPSFSRCNTAVEPRMPFSTSGSINQ